MLVRAVIKHWPRNDDVAFVARARRLWGQPSASGPASAPGVVIEQVRDGVRGEWLIPEQLRLPDSVLLFIHGGGFVSCSPVSHRPISVALARLIGCRVFSLDYRLAPEHPFPAAVEDSVAAFKWLATKGYSPKKVALSGDSAGGGLVMATMVSLRDQGAALPACAACIAPSVDLTGDHPLTNAKNCAMFLPEDGQAFARIYLNGASPHSGLASPLLADLKGIPPLLIQVSDQELLFDDSARLHEKATAAGVQSRLHVFHGLPHDWHMFSGMIPEGKEALREIAEFVKGKLA